MLAISSCYTYKTLRTNVFPTSFPRVTRPVCYSFVTGKRPDFYYFIFVLQGLSEVNEYFDIRTSVN